MCRLLPDHFTSLIRKLLCIFFYQFDMSDHIWTLYAMTQVLVALPLDIIAVAGLSYERWRSSVARALLIVFLPYKLQVAAYDTLEKKMAFFDPSRAKDFLFISGTKVGTISHSWLPIEQIKLHGLERSFYDLFCFKWSILVNYIGLCGCAFW